MKPNKYVSNLLDNKIEVSDSEIQALANLSQKTDAYIREYYDNGQYFMVIKFDKESEDEIILASTNKEEYKKMSTEFFRKFIYLRRCSFMILRKIRKSVGFSLFFVGMIINYTGLLIGFGYKTANEYLWGEAKTTLLMSNCQKCSDKS